MTILQDDQLEKVGGGLQDFEEIERLIKNENDNKSPYGNLNPMRHVEFERAWNQICKQDRFMKIELEKLDRNKVFEAWAQGGFTSSADDFIRKQCWP